MKINYVLTKIPFLASFVLISSLFSCGSYQYTGSANDGIYGSEDYNSVEYVNETEKDIETPQSNYYQNYFSEKSKEYEMILDDSEVFTDIDSYKGEYKEETIDTLQYNKAYAGWGQDTSDISINFYNNNWYPWYYRPYWNIGYGWSYNYYDPFWSYPYFNSWHNPYWYNYGFYGHPYYSYYGYPYYNNHYYNGIYGRNNYVYNRSRRGSLLNRNFNTTSSRSSAVSRTINNSVRPRTITPRSNTPTPRTTTTPRNNTPRTRITTPRSSTPRTYTPRSNSSSSRSYSPSSSSSSTRSSSSTPRSSSSRRRG